MPFNAHPPGGTSARRYGEHARPFWYPISTLLAVIAAVPDPGPAVASKLSGPQARLMLRVMLYTGARLNEVLGIRGRDVDVQGRTLTILHEKSKRALRAGEDRRERRVVMIDGATWQLLAAECALHEKQPSRRLFEVSDRRVQQIVVEAGVAAGVTGLHPHTFRH
jgi:integrase